MAELAALGAAAGIAQFVDLGFRAISAAREALSSADGLTARSSELLKIAQDVEEQCKLLAADSAFSKPGSPLAALLKQSIDASEELSKEIKWMQVGPRGRRRDQARARALWRAFRGKDGILRLETRLSALRAQICSHILASLR